MRRLRLGCQVSWVESGPEDGSDFWSFLGPLATDKEVVRALGSPVLTDSEHRWLFALSGQAPIAMSCRILPRREGRPGWFDQAFVADGYRLRGIWSAMIRYHLSEAVSEGVGTMRAVTEQMQAPMRKLGFDTYRQRGRWSYMERKSVS